ncbi:hypothetical protein Tco_0160991, partial [Tanacetum coccineum]
GRKIDDINADVGITLVDETQGRHDDDLIFDIGVLNNEEVFTGQDMAKKEVSTADPVTTAGEVVTTANDKGKAKMIEPEKPLKKKDQIKFDEEEALRLQAAFDEEDRLAREKAQQVEEKRNRLPTRAQQRSIMCTYLKNMIGWKPKDLENKSFVSIQELFDKAMTRVNTFVDMDIELVEGNRVRVEGSETREETVQREQEMS